MESCVFIVIMFIFAAVLRVLVHHDRVADDDTDEADDTQDGGDGYIQAEEPQTEHRAEDTEHGAGEGQQGETYLTERPPNEIVMPSGKEVICLSNHCFTVRSAEMALVAPRRSAPTVMVRVELRCSREV